MLTLRDFGLHILDHAAHRRLPGREGQEARRWLLVIPREWTLEGTLKAYVEAFEASVAGRFLPSSRAVWYSLTDLPRPQVSYLAAV